MIAGVESNLLRLGTYYVDVIQSHISFRDPTLENFVEGFQRLEKAGKVRAYGLSTSDIDYIRAFDHDGRCATLQIDARTYPARPSTAERALIDRVTKSGTGRKIWPA